MMKMRAWLASACLAAAMFGCGGPEPTPVDGGDGDGDVDDGGRNPCDGLTLCTTVGTSCEGDDLVTCAVNADGCMAERTTRCTTDDQVCDDSSGTAACVDPCSLIPAAERCDVLARECTDGDTLEVCAANADGCYVRTATECGDMPGGVCDDATMPMCVTEADPCAGTPDACTTAGTSCDGDSLVTCAPNAFGCLVETTTDCTERASGTCDATGTVAACAFTGDPCTGITECTVPAEPTCQDGPTLVTCAADGFGCMVETRTDCTEAAFGFCDETATGPDTCATAATDPCMGMTECGTAASLTCSSDGTALVDCAPNAFGCFVEERTVCSGSCSTAGGTPECTGPAPGCAEAGTRVINCASGTVTGDTSMGTSANVGDYGDCAAGTDYAGNEQYWRFEHTGATPVEVTIETTTTSDEDLDLFVLDGAASECTAADPICIVGGLTTSADEEVVFRADPSDVAWVAYDMYDAPSATATYSMTVTCAPIVCGDGIVMAGEQCDDDNTAAGDGCSATCQLEAGYRCDDEPSVCVMVPPQALCATARTVTADVTFTGENIALGGPRPQGTGCGTNTGDSATYYAVTVPPRSGVEVTTDATPDLVLLAQDACGGACTFRTDSPEELDLANATDTAVTRIVSVHGYSTSTTGTFDIEFTYSVCGDGIVGAGEGCDDGGTANGNGCSSMCQLEPNHVCTGAPSTCEIACGNGRVDTVAGETCDDGGITSGNGCSATCAIEPTYVCSGAPSVCVVAPPHSFCPGARVVTASAQFTGENIALGGPRPQGTGCNTNSGNRAAYYSVTVPPMTTVEVTTDSSADLVLIVQDACDATSCLARTDTPEELDLVNTTDTAFTRIVSVHGYSSSTTGTFDITFMYPAFCGDGFTTTGETCDDANTADGDGCSAACALETGYACFGTPSVCRLPAANSMCSGARPVTQPATTDTVAFTSEDLRAGGPAGRTTNCGAGTSTTALFYTVTVPPATAVTITATPTGPPAWNLVLADTADCAATACGTATNSGAVGVPETRRLVNTTAAAVTRTFLVRSATATLSTFDIAFTYAAVACGDGFVDAPEACDDGGTANGNGCSSTCTIEPGFLCTGAPSACRPLPANRTCDTATPITANTSIADESTLGGGPLPGTGCGTGVGVETLYYSISIPPGATVRAQTAPDQDIVLMTQNACGEPTCASTTDSSPEQASFTNPTTSTITRIVAVRRKAAGEATYDISFTYQQCGDGVLSGTETCEDGGLVAGDGCSPTCAVETDFVCTGTPSVCTRLYTRAPIPAMCADTSAAAPLTLTSGGSAADDKASAITALPFPLTYFGQTVTHFSASMNGFVQLFDSSTGTIVPYVTNTRLPNTATPNGTIAAFWDDLYQAGGGQIRTMTTGTAGSRVFTIAWEGWGPGSGGPTMTFQAQIFEGTNVIEFHYCSVTGTTTRASGDSATIGLENQAGTAASLQSFDTAGAVMTGSGFRFTPI